MNITLLPQYLVETLGWTLIHWLWQGLAVAIILAVLLKAFAKISSNRRYLIGCIALTAMMVTPTLTFKVLSSRWDRPIKVAAEEFKQTDIGLLRNIEMPVVENIVADNKEVVAPVIEISFAERISSAIEAKAGFIVYGWLIGVFGFCLWHLGGWRQLQKLRRTMVKPVGEKLISKMNKLSCAIGVKKVVSMMESALIQGPMVVGWLKPMILLPGSALMGLSPEQLEAILAHELAHIRRCDYLVNIIQTAVEIVGFYNPAIWWVSAKIRAERENCCDDVAVALIGDKIGYVRALTTMEEVRCGYKLAVAGSGGSLFDRAKRLLTKDKDISGEKSLLTAAVAVLLLAMVAIPAGFAMSSKADKRADSISKAGSGDYKVTLDSGVTVELVGVCDYPQDGPRSWRPDGSRLEKQVYATKWNRKNPKPGEFGFIFKLDGPEDLSFTWNKIKESESLEGSCQVVDYQGNILSGFEAAIAFFRNESSKTSLRVGIATGLWNKVASHDGKGMCMTQGIAFATAYESDGAVRIVVTDGLGSEVVHRIIAIDENGNIHTCKGNSGSVSNQNLRQTTANFPGLNLKQIKEFQFQTRPFEWVEFKDVSLKPGNKTAEQVEKTEKVDNSSVTVEEGVGFDDIIVGDVSWNSRIKRLDIDSATDIDIKNIFGEPVKYIWEEQVFDKDALPGHYIMVYPGHFHVFIMNNHVLEIRFEGPSDYVFGDGLVVGSSIEKVLSVLGQPSQVLDGKPNEFQENVFYKNIDGKKGWGYYARPDKNIRIWILDNKVKAIYLTRSNYSAGGGIELKEAELPETSFIDENDHIVDKIDYPFINDPEVIGTWKSVDFVEETEQFKVGEQHWKGRGDKLFLHEMIFEKDGKLISKNDNEPNGFPETWTDGLVFYNNDTKTASKYIIKEIDGSQYMFYEWKSGDYTFRHMKPKYYVLKKTETTSVSTTANTPQILTIARLLFVPMDMPEVQELIGTDITPEKLETFLKVVRNTPQARIVAAPQLVTNDGEMGEMRTGNYEDASTVMRIANTVDFDDKTIKVQLSFEYSCMSPKGWRVSLLSTDTTTQVSSGHAFIVSGMAPQEGQSTILLVAPKILERQFSKTGVVGASDAEMENRFAVMKSNVPGISVTVFPIIMSDRPYKNVAEVVALMLEKADVNNVDVSDEVFSPAVNSDIWQICSSFEVFVREKSIDTDYALFGEYVGTQQNGVKEVRCVVVDKAGNRVWVDRQVPEDEDFKRIRPNNPMLCSHLLVERLRTALGLPEQSGKNSMQGKWAKFWEKDSGAPQASERDEMTKRLAIMRGNFKNAKLVIFPTLVNGKPDNVSAENIMKMFKDKQLSLTGSVSQEVSLDVTPVSNQQKRLWDLADKFKEYIQGHKLEADYALYADYLIDATKGVKGVHFVICDSNGGWVVVDFQNEYQSDFKSISPKTISDCDGLVIKRIQGYLNGSVGAGQ